MEYQQRREPRNFDLEEQHRHIHSVLDAIADSALRGRTESADVLVAYLDRLLRIHFEAEESLAVSCGYPDLNAHVREHREFLAQLSQHVQEFQQSGFTDSERLRTLANRVYAHTTGADQVLSRYLDQTAASTVSQARMT